MSEDWAIRAFGDDQVEQLTGLSARRLWSWARRGFITPSHSIRRGRGGRRLYDFRDLVSLRVAADLLSQGVGGREISKAHAHLRSLDFEKPLAEVPFWVYDRHLYFSEADTLRAGRRPEQTVPGFMVPVPQIVDDLEKRILKLDQRPIGEIERRRGVLGSKPVIKGTRIPIAAIRRLAEDGLSEAQIRECYPDLEPADIRAALAEPRPRPRVAHAV
jgi:uncharacterized protein (DUF433 family)